LRSEVLDVNSYCQLLSIKASVLEWCSFKLFGRETTEFYIHINEFIILALQYITYYSLEENGYILFIVVNKTSAFNVVLDSTEPQFSMQSLLIVVQIEKRITFSESCSETSRQ
jgi:hypothetical protein